MTIDFKARTRDQLQGIDDPPKPGELLPIADEECLRELGATENWPRTCEYWHPKHSLSDFSKPGYFDGDLRARMHPGDQIYYCLYGGSKDPCDWQRGIAVVVDVPSSRQDPLILAGILEYPAPQPWTGDKKDKAA